MRRILVATLATVLTLAGAAAPAAAATPVAGAAGVGDEYFPDYGNGGYDVSHYDIRLRYWPDSDRLTGTTTISATAEQDLSSFNLDFILDVSSIVVNNRTATFAREGDHELVVTPARPILDGQAITVIVNYSGVPSTKEAAGYTAWIRTPDGALAVGEPEEAWWWFPSNDHPSDKATFDVSVLVPDSLEVLSNGVQPRDPVQELIGWKRWYWRSAKPQATYLAFIAVGNYDITRDVADDGTPVINAYSQLLPDDYEQAARASVERTTEITDWESSLFGPWPYTARGGVVAPPDTLTFALENQTRPVYSAAFFRAAANQYVVVHENAHQWFGDYVSVSQWKEIWLNEGFASYVEWLWSERQGEGTTDEIFDYLYATAPDSFWTVQPGDPGPADVFDGAVYDRGAMTLHQLRRTVGDEAFFEILRTWIAEHAYGNANTSEFITLSEAVSGQELDDLFGTWLYTPEKPVLENPPTLADAVANQPESWSQIQETLKR